MQMKTSADIRQLFLDYFQSKQHTVVPSSSLVPANDSTLLFTNAGMVQFKDVFLGQEKRAYSRAASAQRCVRAGGKHNDLDNVGYTARHHTFFEMLGNFSFGDYFKEQAIQYAWEFLTSVLCIPRERLVVTVYENDEEAAQIWLNKFGVHAIRCHEKDNFWSMGDTGPCGPCTEIYYDHGESIAGGLPGSAMAEGDRYVEIWNLVFMQYERHADGAMSPLPKPSVDTGMGLERVAAIMQGVHSNYDTDLFRYLISAAAKLAKTTDLTQTSLRVLADHIRSTAFLITDGVVPHNEGRGYVLRRIIRRAIRHGYQLGMTNPFFYQLVDPLIHVMGEAYPELINAKARVEQTLLKEEQQFALTLAQGMKLFQQAIQSLSSNIVPGEIVFKLYDTYGFPADLTADLARERELCIDEVGFDREMQRQRARSQETHKFSANYITVEGKSTFIGYDFLETPIAEIQFINADAIVLDHTPFYAESGGQVGDNGIIQNANGTFIVENTKKQGQLIIHYGHLQTGCLSVGESVSAKVNQKSRQATALNHSATHLLHAALQKIIGNHVQQKGSLVAPDRLRFDFTHSAPLTETEITAIEKLVNEQIRENHAAIIAETTPEKAIKNGAMALFGEKYGETVRTLKLGEFSYEVCGGTHVKRTGDIGVFKIIGETGIAAGVRRIEAVTGEKAVNYIQENAKLLQTTMQLLKASRDTIVNKLQQLVEQQRCFEKNIEQLQNKLSNSVGSDLLAKAKEVNGIKVIAAQLDQADNKMLRDTVDQLKQKLGSGIVVLGAVQNNKVNVVIGVTKDLSNQYPANQIMTKIAEMIDGKGGGRPDLAQAGGGKPEALEEALSSVVKWVI